MDHRKHSPAGIVGALKSAAIAAALFGTVHAASAQPPMPPHEKPRRIAVSGEAEESVAPDRARLPMSVFKVGPEVATAETEVNRIVKAYVAEARKLGAKDEQISTAGVGIQPEYVWDEKERKNNLVGYRVSREIEVRITSLDKLGAFLLAATRAGVNQVNPPALESSKAKEVQNQALAKAALDAQSKARLLADTLGVKLGSLRSLSENGGGQPSPQPMMKAMAMRSAAADSNESAGIETGEIRYSASVSAEFDLAPP